MNIIEYIVKNPKGFSIQDIKKKDAIYIVKVSEFGNIIEKKLSLVFSSVGIVSIVLSSKDKSNTTTFPFHNLKSFRKDLTSYLLNLGFKGKEELNLEQAHLDLSIEKEIIDKRTLYVPIGFPGSGKTFLGHGLFLNWDIDVYIDLERGKCFKKFDEKDDSIAINLDKKNLDKLNSSVVNQIDKMLSYNKNLKIYLDGLFLKSKEDIKVIKNLFKDYDIVFCFFTGKKKDLLSNLKKRGDSPLSHHLEGELYRPKEGKSIKVVDHEIYSDDYRYYDFLKERDFSPYDIYAYSSSYAVGEGKTRDLYEGWSEEEEDHTQDAEYWISGFTDEEIEKMKKEDLYEEVDDDDYLDPYWDGQYKCQRIVLKKAFELLR